MTLYIRMVLRLVRGTDDVFALVRLVFLGLVSWLVGCLAGCVLVLIWQLGVGSIWVGLWQNAPVFSRHLTRLKHTLGRMDRVSSAPTMLPFLSGWTATRKKRKAVLLWEEPLDSLIHAPFCEHSHEKSRFNKRERHSSEA